MFRHIAKELQNTKGKKILKMVTEKEDTMFTADFSTAKMEVKIEWSSNYKMWRQNKSTYPVFYIAVIQE
jgi:hypothetical protein